MVAVRSFALAHWEGGPLAPRCQCHEAGAERAVGVVAAGVGSP